MIEGDKIQSEDIEILIHTDIQKNPRWDFRMYNLLDNGYVE